MKSIRFKTGFIASLLSFVVPLSCATNTPNQNDVKEKGTINVKGLFDLSGPTLDIGIPYSKGVLNKIEDINKNGGIKGYKINIDYKDYAYDVATAEKQYNEWKMEKDWDKIVTIFGWGTGDTVKLSPTINEDKKTYISASYSENLTDPSKTPYNFFAGTDYTTSIRLAVKYVRKVGGKKIGFAYCSAGMCKDAIPGGKEQAQTEGINIGGDVGVELSYNDENGKPLSDDKLREKIYPMMEEYFKKNTDLDWVWIGNTTKTASIIIEAGAKYAPNIKFITFTWGFDENTDSTYCRDKMCRTRSYGVFPFAAYGDTAHADGMIELVDLHNKYNKSDEYANIRYVQGYLSVLLFEKAVEKVIAEGKEITSPEIRAKLETFENLSTGGLTAPITFSPKSHKPNKQLSIYQLDENGRFKFSDNLSL